jgi:DNA-binding protein HU-beta
MPKKPDILRIFWGYPIVGAGFMRVFTRPPAKGAELRGFLALVPHKEIAVNKAELTTALAMRTKMSKADATRTIEALFDDKGIIAAELKKGSKVQITGFGNFEARKRAARMGRNPKTGGVIQIKASIAPAFRAGKQLKMAVNNKK